MKAFRILLTIAMITILNSCSTAEDGADGINGTNGTNGTNGVDGQTGATGTANVIYSAWITAPAAIAETVDGTAGMSTNINAPELSQEILDKGTVLVYVYFGLGTFSLPYTSLAGGNSNTITAISFLKKIKLFRFNHNGVGTTNIPVSLSWRYILIPGGVIATTGKEVKLDYAKMSYQEVCRHFNIQP